jgi:3-oxoacyl-[acyl-carrier-protein] synthase-3
MGTRAAERALEAAELNPGDIDLIIVATMTPDYISSSTAALIQHQLGASRAAAMDLQAACSGFIYGLATAQAFVASGLYRHVLLVATEKMSSVMDYQDRSSCILFGDGATAVVVGPEARGLKLGPFCLHADGQHVDLISVPAGGARLPTSQQTVEQRQHYMLLSGNEVYKLAVRAMTTAAQQCLEMAEIDIQELSWLVPHQANERIIDSVAKSCNLPLTKVFKTIHKYGNTSASSIGIALDELLRTTPLASDATILLIAFGAGLTWGASVLKKI